MAAFNPFCIAIVKKAAVIISLHGSPKETFETPRIVFPCFTSFTYFTVCNVASAALSSELTAMARGSIMMSFSAIPNSFARE